MEKQVRFIVSLLAVAAIGGGLAIVASGNGDLASVGWGGIVGGCIALALAFALRGEGDDR